MENVCIALFWKQVVKTRVIVQNVIMEEFDSELFATSFQSGKSGECERCSIVWVAKYDCQRAFL